MQYKTKNEKETQKVAADFAKRLRGGEAILLYGDLGAGKTVFVKGLAEALGVREVVKSPTFNLMKVYSLPKRYTPNAKRFLCHIDAYRLKNFDDLLDVGADEYLGKRNVISVVEWADRVKGIEKSADKIIKIKIRHKEGDEREIEIK